MCGGQTRDGQRVPKNFLRRLWRCERGVTAIEFAAVAPVLFSLILGIMEVSFIMLAQSIIESATGNVARVGKSGYVESSSTREATIFSELQHYNSAIVDVSKVSITSLSYQTFDQVGEPEPYVDSNHNNLYDVGEVYSDLNHNGRFDTDRGLPGYGNQGDIVVYTVTYPWKILNPLMAAAVSGGIEVLSSRMVVKNEPYNVDASF